MLEQPGDSGQPFTLLITPPNIISQDAVADKGITPAHTHTPAFAKVPRSAATQEQYFQTSPKLTKAA